MTNESLSEGVHCHWATFLTEFSSYWGVSQITECDHKIGGRGGVVPNGGWGTAGAHLLLLGGRKEPHHLHGLLEPFKVMLQIFPIFDLQVMLKNKVGGALGAFLDCCGWQSRGIPAGPSGAGPRAWRMNGLFCATSSSQSGGQMGPGQTASDLPAGYKQPMGNRGGVCGRESGLFTWLR